MKRTITTILIALAGAAVMASCSNVELGDGILKAGEPFRDGMVLAKDKPVNVFGEGRGRVVVKVAGKKATAKARDGKWEAVLPQMEAGGPYTMTIRSKGDKVVFEDVYVGRVIVLAGQSNIQFKLRESSTPESEWTGPDFDS